MRKLIANDTHHLEGQQEQISILLVFMCALLILCGIQTTYQSLQLLQRGVSHRENNS